MSVTSSRVILIIGLGFVFICEVAVHENCYKLTFTSCKTTDTKNYRLNATLMANDSLSTVTKIGKDIGAPIWKFVIMERGRGTANTKVHFNGLLNTCDMAKSMNNIRILKQLLSPIFKDPRKGNFTFKCPLREGVYVLNDIFVPAQSGPIVKYLYSPNSVYTISFKIVQRLPNNKIEKLSSMELNAVIRKLC